MLGTVQWPPSQYGAGNPGSPPRGLGAGSSTLPATSGETPGVSAGETGAQSVLSQPGGGRHRPSLTLTLSDRSAVDMGLHGAQEARGAQGR